MLIKNDTDLSNAEIGHCIDEITKRGQEDTHYVGQIEWLKIDYCDKEIQVQIRYLKRYTEWYFWYKNK